MRYEVRKAISGSQRMMQSGPDKLLTLPEWRGKMLGYKNSAEWLQGLNKALSQRDSTITCQALIGDLNEIGYFDDCIDAHKRNALYLMAAEADTMTRHAYHNRHHVLDVMLTTIALVDWIEKYKNKKFSSDFKFNALCAATSHDNFHPGMAAAKSVKTESEAISEGLDSYYKELPLANLIPILLGVMATAYPYFPNPNELHKRMLENSILLSAKEIDASEITVELVNASRQLYQIIGMADVLPSLCSAQRLAIGSAKVTQEFKPVIITSQSVLMNANMFLKIIGDKRFVLAANGILVNWEKLGQELRSQPYKMMVDAYLRRHSAHADAVTTNTVARAGNHMFDMMGQ